MTATEVGLIILIVFITIGAYRKDQQLRRLEAKLAPKPHPTTCVAVYVLNDKNELLIGLRTHENTVKGQPEWAIPGGKIDHLEKAKKAAFREVEEESGLRITIERDGFLCYGDDMFLKDNHPRHFVTLFFQGRICNSIEDSCPTPRVMEPSKLAEWKWVALEECPELFANAHLNIKKLRIAPQVSETK